MGLASLYRSQIDKPGAKQKIVYLFIILFYISMIQSYRLLALTAGVITLYSLLTSDNKFILRFLKPVLPFAVLILLPLIIRYFLGGTLADLDFTLILLAKILISSLLLGTIVAQNSALYLVDGILSLGLPPLFNRILALTFRYFHMVNEDVQIGRKALNSRGINRRKGLSALSIFGEWIGGFFLKSTYHSEMVFQAMKSRGFQGVAREEGLRNKKLIRDSLVLILFLALVLIIDGMV